jgi:hypothetical protein
MAQYEGVCPECGATLTSDGAGGLTCLARLHTWTSGNLSQLAQTVNDRSDGRLGLNPSTQKKKHPVYNQGG